MCENAHGTATRGQSLEAPAADTQILRACAAEMHVDDLEGHECTVNSSGLAGHARVTQRSKHSCFSIAVSTLLGEFIFAPWLAVPFSGFNVNASRRMGGKVLCISTTADQNIFLFQEKPPRLDNHNQKPDLEKCFCQYSF